MLNNDGGGLFELEDDAGGRVKVEEVGERQFLALENLRVAQTGRGPAIPGRFLVRVFTVPQVADLFEPEVEPVAEVRAILVGGAVGAIEAIPLDLDRRQRGRDRAVVRRGVRDGLSHQLEPECQAGGVSSALSRRG